MSDIVERLLAYAKVWGNEPSIPPHPDTSPGFTTGMVIGDANEAAEEIKRLRAALDDMIDLAETVAGSDAYSSGAYHDRLRAARKALR